MTLWVGSDKITLKVYVVIEIAVEGLNVRVEPDKVTHDGEVAPKAIVKELFSGSVADGKA